MEYLPKIQQFLLDVHENVVHPHKDISLEHFLHHVFAIALFTVILRCVHGSVLRPIKKEAQYFALHTWVNLVIVIISLPYGVELLANPSRSMFCNAEGICSNQLPNVLTAALHFYHMWMFTLKPIDLIHHIPAFVASFFNMVYPTGPIQNFTFLFIMGIPGGYDYALLVGIKHGFVGKMVEKRANSRLNLWLRSPGLIVSSFCIYQGLSMHNDEFLTLTHKIGSSIVLIHNLWNAQYFMNRAIQSEAIHAVMRDRESPTRVTEPEKKAN